jgi:hypothetical protein
VDHNSRVATPISVRPVAGRRDFRRFINHPYERHAGDPHWIPPLRIAERQRLTPRRNPFFEHADVALFLAWRGDRVAGRIGAIDDRLHQATHNDGAAMFGFFEADAGDTAAALLSAAETWARGRGRRAVRGPINPSLNDHAGLLIDGFDADPMILMPHNPPAYAGFIEAAGYRKIKDLYAWLYEIGQAPPAAIARLAERVKGRLAVSVRPLDVRRFTAEAGRLRDLYTSAWQHNWGFVPPTDAEFARIASEMKPIFDPRCSVCAEAGGRMIACAVALPDINQALKGTSGRLLPLALPRLLMRRGIDQARLLLLGVEAGYRSAGIYPLLLLELHRQMHGRYRRVEFSWVLEENRDINQPAEIAGASRYKTYRIYEKAIG